MRKPVVLIIGLFLIACMVFPTAPANAQASAPAEKPAVVLKAYGPGGPAPAMRESAKVFGEKKGISVEIKAGPTPSWKDSALKDADLIFSGSEYMMTDFVKENLQGLIDTATIHSLYLRPTAILVRPGNPKNIKGTRDIANPGLKLLVVQGAGQVGMWEDMAGRTGDVKLVDAVRRNIGSYAPNTAEAKKLWKSDPSYDAWIVWTIWQKEDPASADLVNTEPESTIYRSCAIAVTNRSEQKPPALEFIDFLQSSEGQAIFVKWGWMAR